jgi:hypothetical protein
MNQGIQWKRVFVEIVAIVGSILLAFSIDAWWDTESQRGAEAALIRALEAELIEARQGFQGHQDFISENMEMDIDALSLLEKRDINSATKEEIEIFANTLARPDRNYSPPRAALDDISNSGNIGLIQSDSVRLAISNYNQQLSLDAGNQQLLIDLWLNQIAPYLYEFGNTPLLGYRDLQQALAIPPVPEAFVDNRKYRNLLKARVMRLDDVDTSHERVVLSITQLMELISTQY